MAGHETEVKFFVKDLGRVEMRLHELKAHLIQPRVHETNLRFDTPGAELRKERKVLRLRQDTEAKFTFKGPGVEVGNGALTREEIEFTVGNFETAKHFLEALNYIIIVFYEKFRTTYELNHVHIMLDEMPYGNFVEIEGENIDALHQTASLLGLNMECGIKTGYHTLFERLVEKFHVDKTQLSFAELSHLPISAQDLGVTPADNHA